MQEFGDCIASQTSDGDATTSGGVSPTFCEGMVVSRSNSSLNNGTADTSFGTRNVSVVFFIWLAKTDLSRLYVLHANVSPVFDSETQLGRSGIAM